MAGWNTPARNAAIHKRPCDPKARWDLWSLFDGTSSQVRMDLRWAGGDINRIGAFAQELVGLQASREAVVYQRVLRIERTRP
jgi:hypothetical protein